MNILCLGKLTYDVFCPINTFPTPGSCLVTAERIECGGGSVANSAYLLGKWGLKPHIVGVVGADDWGTKIKKEFDSVQVDTSFIETSYEKPTIITFNPITKSDGQGFNLEAYVGNYAFLRKREFGIIPDLLLIEEHDYGAAQEILEKNPHSVSILAATKMTPEVMQLAKFTKYILGTQAFAEAVTKIKADLGKPATLVDLYQNLIHRFPNTNVIITLGVKGTLYKIKQEIKYMPGINGKILDLNGTESAFRGAFAYSLMNKFEIEKAISYANIAAGITAQKIGTRMAMPTLNEVVSYYSQKNPNAFKTQPSSAEQVSSSGKPSPSVAPNQVPVSEPTPTPAKPVSNQPAGPIPTQMPKIPKN